jgi:hypothetical protein
LTWREMLRGGYFMIRAPLLASYSYRVDKAKMSLALLKNSLLDLDRCGTCTE